MSESRLVPTNGILGTLREIVGWPAPPDRARAEAITNLAWDNELLQERLSTLELQLEDRGWTNVFAEMETEFSREALRRINAMARLMWIKNPLIQRAVNVQGYYVFGQGVEISAQDEEIDAVVQKFWSDAKNEAELTSQQALVTKENELTLFGNVYFVLFVNNDTGRVRVRTLPVSEVEDIITNPEDKKDPWWYKRVYREVSVEGRETEKVTYYKDWLYLGSEAPPAGKGDVSPAVVFHVKVGGLSDMKFGVSEVYAGMDWAKAYKNFLEDWATIVRAYARFAWNLTVTTKRGIVTAKGKLESTLGTTTAETNPPPNVASTFIGAPGVSMSPIRTSGATTDAEDGRRLLLMVAASSGLPETFFGDVSVGTLATANSLDRPTELKMVNRQNLWRDSIQALLRFVVVQAVKANTIKGTVEPEDDGTPELVFMPVLNELTQEMEDRDTTINVDFPPILEHDVKAGVAAIVEAATLGGKPLAGVIDEETVSRLLLTALNEKDVQALLEIIYPPDEDGDEDEDTDDAVPEPDDDEEEPVEDDNQAESIFVDAVTTLQQAVTKILEEG